MTAFTDDDVAAVIEAMKNPSGALTQHMIAVRVIHAAAPAIAARALREAADALGESLLGDAALAAWLRARADRLGGAT